MFARSIPRFLLQAGFLIVAASSTAVAHLGVAAIVLVMAAAFGLVVAGERLASGRRAESVTTAPAAAEPARPGVRGPETPPEAGAPGQTGSPWLPVPPLSAMSAELDVRPAPAWPSGRGAMPPGPVEAPPSQ